MIDGMEYLELPHFQLDVVIECDESEIWGLQSIIQIGGCTPRSETAGLSTKLPTARQYS